MKKEKYKKYLIYIFLIILIMLLSVLLQKGNKKSVTKTEEYEYSLNIANSININTSHTISSEPNAPQLGAGMIPIKYVNKEWKITTADDPEWYNYSTGKMATVMLSDGYYKSELQYGIDEEKQLAENNVGNSLFQDIGTIFVWIPRLTYTEDEIMYLNGTSIVETDKISLPKCFTYKLKNQPELAIEGIWVEQEPQETKNSTTSIIDEMCVEENKYGLIKNEIVESVNKDVCKVVERLLKGKKEKEQQVKNLDNINRTMIRIINTNVNTPIIVKTHTAEKKSYINVVYSDNMIKEIISLDTNQSVQGVKSAVFDTRENGIYTFAIVDIVGNVKIATTQVGDGTPDFTGFKINTTFMVLYSNDEEETEHSDVPIEYVLKNVETDNDNTLIKGSIDFNKVAEIEQRYDATWYSYEEQKWANIVVRNNANEAYYTWIPRYVYQLDYDAQVSHTKFVNIDNEDSDGNEMDLTEWTLPEAFTWIDEEGEITQIPGFWVGKYALSNTISFNLQANVVGGINKIRVNNITNSSGLSDVTYDIYLYEAGEDSTKIKSAKNNQQVLKSKVDPETINDKDYYAIIENAVAGGTYQFNSAVKTNTDIVNTLEAGDYAIRIVLKDSRGIYRGENWFTASVTDTAVTTEIPDLTGFRVNTTYLVTYTDPDDENTMEATIPISSILSDGYEVDPTTNTLSTGNVDENKVKEVLKDTGKIWYDYSKREWANIVTRNAGSESYYTWIPRYVYRLDEVDQTTEIKFINTTEEYSEGWTLPEAFTWVDEEGITKQLSGFWVGKYALSNTTDLDLHVDNSDTILGGVNKLILNNVTCNLSDITYKIYVYDHNKDNTVNEYNAEGTQFDPDYQLQDGSYYCNNRQYVRYYEMSPDDTKSVIFTYLNGSIYDVRIAIYDSRGYYRGEKWYKDIVVLTKVDGKGLDADINEMIMPKVDEGFNPDCTYYVTEVNDDGSAKQKVSIKNTPPSGWYDYNNQKWANIVVENGNNKAYFVWIPRYIYKLDEVRQYTEIKFVGTNITKENCPEGWTLPEAFTWVDENNETQQLTGYWVGKYALSNAN